MNSIVIYLGILLVVFCWVVTPFLRKIVLKKTSTLEMFMCTQLIVTVYIILAYLIIKIRNPTSYDFKSILDLNRNETITLFLAAAATFFSSFALIYLLKYNEATYIMPQLQPITIVLTILAGIFIFKEKVSLMEGFGVLVILIGVIMMNYFKTDK
tara:strand:- start:303 stop:767 length:465 start_codon:yes stop_codon:yes gene_type:complete